MNPTIISEVCGTNGFNSSAAMITVRIFLEYECENESEESESFSERESEERDWL